jgi:hypothetical protein
MQYIDEQRDPSREPSTRNVPPAAERVRDIRSRLPGQVLWERIETARATYGPLYTLAEVQQSIGDTLPPRLGYRRSAVCEPIETYRGSRIPDEALLKYDEAAACGLFTRFWVATPTYREERQTDPWIVGEVVGIDRYAVIARWD